MPIKTVMKTVSMPLTEQKTLEVAKVAALKSKELDDLQEQFKNVSGDWKGRMKKLTHDIYVLQSAIREGKIDEELECEVDYDPKQGIVRYLHGGKEVERRVMSEEERQMDFEDGVRHG